MRLQRWVWGVALGALACRSDLPTGETSARAQMHRVEAELTDSIAGFVVVDSYSVAGTGLQNGERQLLIPDSMTGEIIIELSSTVGIAGDHFSIGDILIDDGFYFWHTWTNAPPEVHSFSAPSGVDEEVPRELLHWTLSTELYTEFGDSVVHVGLPIPTTPTMDVARYRLTPPPGYPLLFSVAGSAGNVSADAYSHGYIEVADGDPVPLPPGGRTVYTAHNDEAERMVTGEIWVKVYGKQPMRLSVSRDTVLPVFADAFNAVTQYTNHPTSAQAQRKDTVRVTIAGSVAGATGRDTVWIVSRPVAGGGGHLHAMNSTIARPRGTFFLLDQLNGVSIGKKGVRDSLMVIVPTGHDTTIVYRTSGVAGKEWVVARRISTAGMRTDSAGVIIHLSGLVEIPQSSANYTMPGSDNHTGCDQYLQPGVITLLDTVWARYRALHTQHPGPYKMIGDRFTLDATSIPDGGLLDIKGTWRTGGHILHREGLDADFNDRGAEDALKSGSDSSSPRERLQSICGKVWFHLNVVDSMRLDCKIHLDGTPQTHFHAFLVPQSRRDALLPWRNQ